MSAAERISDVVPVGWEIAAVPFPGTLFQALGPGGAGEFRSSLSLCPGVADGSSEEDRSEAETLEVAHDRQLESAFLLLTDALLVDHRAVVVSGQEALVSTIAFRQGCWTLTSLLWTIDAGDGPVVAVATCDADRFDAEAPLFESMVAAVKFDAAGSLT